VVVRNEIEQFDVLSAIMVIMITNLREFSVSSNVSFTNRSVMSLLEMLVGCDKFEWQVGCVRKDRTDYVFLESAIGDAESSDQDSQVSDVHMRDLNTQLEEKLLNYTVTNHILQYCSLVTFTLERKL